MQLLAWYLFIAGHAVVAACFVAFVLRQRWKQYPIFLVYLGCELASFVVGYTLEYLMSRSLASIATYRWASVYTDLLSTGVELALLYGLADRLILSRSLLGATLRPLLRWSSAILLLIAAATSVFVSRPGLDRVLNVFETLNFAAHLIVIGILFVLLVFSHALQVPWRSLSAGIALGFGIYSGIEMASSALISAFGQKSVVPMDVLRMSGLLVGASVWLVYILLPDRSVPRSGSRLGKSEIEFWDQELERMVQ